MLTVKELRALLDAVPGELPVYLGDWNEWHADDHPCSREDVEVLPACELPERWGGGTLPKRLRIGQGPTYGGARRR